MIVIGWVVVVFGFEFCIVFDDDGGIVVVGVYWFVLLWG